MVRMQGRTDYLKAGFEKIDTDLEVSIGCFAEVLEQLGFGQLAECLPWKSGETGKESLPPRAGQAYSIAFQLLNIIEEQAAGKVRIWREGNQGPLAERGLWGFFCGSCAARE